MQRSTPSKSDQKEGFVDHADPTKSRSWRKGWKIRVPLPLRCGDKLRLFRGTTTNAAMKKRRREKGNEGKATRKGEKRNKKASEWSKKKKEWNGNAGRKGEGRGNWRGFDVTLINPRCLSFWWNGKFRFRDNSDIKIHRNDWSSQCTAANWSILTLSVKNVQLCKTCWNFY